MRNLNAFGEYAATTDKQIDNHATMFLLMHKNIEVALIVFDREHGILERLLEVFRPKHLPLGVPATLQGIKSWWLSRTIPSSRKRLKNLLRATLEETNLALTLANKGLTLIDHYWVKHISEDVTWEDINFFTNEFNDELGELLFDNKNIESIVELSPTSSLDGQMTKRWIVTNNNRVLIKVDERYNNQIIANEFIASRIYSELGFTNYVKYYPISVVFKGTQRYACACKCFADNETEFVPLRQLLRFDTKKNHESEYSRLIRLLTSYGVDKNEVKSFLEFQFTVDFILTNTDRHTGNYGILVKDSKVIMAPVYDNGNSMFYDLNQIPFGKEMRNIISNNIFSKEIRFSEYVDIPKLNFTKLLDLDFKIQECLENYTTLERSKIYNIVEGYRTKINITNDLIIRR